MFKLFRRNKSQKLEWEWYCTFCGKGDIKHDENGRLLGGCDMADQRLTHACPLDIRLKSES